MRCLVDTISHDIRWYYYRVLWKENILKLKTKSFLYSTTRRHDDAFASEALICYDATITARVPTPAQARKLTALEDINHQSSFVGLLILKKVWGNECANAVNELQLC